MHAGPKKFLRRAICLVGAALTLTRPSPLAADVVLDWNALTIDCIRADNTAPTAAARNLAILHTAIWDAVNSVTRTHQPYAFLLDAPANTSVEAAAVSAAYEVVTWLYPSFQAWADDLYQVWLGSAATGDPLDNGIHLGAQVAQLILELRSDDGASTDVPYIPNSEPGQWQRTPPFFRPPLAPQWGDVVPFCLADLAPFAPPPPPALDSPEYAAALNEVKILGAQDNAARTAEQSEIAMFWSDFSYTSSPPGHWQEIAAAIARDSSHTLVENARLFALLSLAQADAGIVCWNAKYRYNLWRPVTAIHRADEDGNTATEADATWNHFLAAPPFPSYTSGHSTFSKASAQLLTRFFGTDAITFTAMSDTLPGVPRTFQSLAACADEVGRSRIYGGIHFEFDNSEGKASGARIGDYIAANFLLPNNSLPAVRIESAGASVQLRVHGHAGATCVVEASTDFTHWQPVLTNSAVTGGIPFRHPLPPHARTRFYRVVEID